jgi:hypothetical protein
MIYGIDLSSLDSYKELSIPIVDTALLWDEGRLSGRTHNMFSDFLGAKNQVQEVNTAGLSPTALSRGAVLI